MNEQQERDRVAELEAKIAKLRRDADRLYTEASLLEQQWIRDNAPIQPGDTISWDYGRPMMMGKTQRRRTGVVAVLRTGICWSLRNHDYEYVIKNKSGYGRREIVVRSWEKPILEKKGDRKA